MLAVLGHTLAVAGRTDDARQVLGRLEARSNSEYVQASRQALIHAGLEDVDAAVQTLDQACEERSRFVVFMRVWPVFDGLHGDPRFDALLQRVGLRGA